MAMVVVKAPAHHTSMFCASQSCSLFTFSHLISAVRHLPSVILTLTYQSRRLDNGQSYRRTSKFSHPRWPLTRPFHLYKCEVEQISRSLPGHLLALSYAKSCSDKSQLSSEATQTGHPRGLTCVLHVISLSVLLNWRSCLSDSQVPLLASLDASLLQKKYLEN